VSAAFEGSGGQHHQGRAHAGAAAVFLAAAGLTAYYIVTMRGGMPMAGGWTMSMMWMRMPAQSPAVAAATFATMWLAMMVAMMLPSSLPMLLLYRRAALFTGAPHPSLRMWLVGAGYFAVWLAFGLAAYAVGMALSSWIMRFESASRAVPVACGAAIAVSGIYQLTSLKTTWLGHCRDPLHVVAQHLHHGAGGALRFGIHHGASCAACCWALMLIQLAVGVMNVAAMIGIAAVITLEKLAPRGDIIARVVGILAVFAGAWMILHSLVAGL
jgi:predicted metal-binding membrane protein